MWPMTAGQFLSESSAAMEMRKRRILEAIVMMLKLLIATTSAVGIMTTDAMAQSSGPIGIIARAARAHSLVEL
jgi:hypothetical protein